MLAGGTAWSSPDAANSLQALAYAVTVAEARERERIAGGLHDDIGQTLAVVGFKLGELSELLGPAHAALVDELRALVRQATRATREATFELSNPILPQLGLKAALESCGQQMARAGGPPVQVEGELPSLALSDAVQSVVFRVARELLLNVSKHARARHARVRLNCDDGRLRVRVEDDGVGFGPQTRRAQFGPDGGFGLFSARAQMQAIGGILTIESVPGVGTWASLDLPLNGD